MSVAELESREIQLEAPAGGLWRDAWFRLRRNPAALAGFGLVADSLIMRLMDVMLAIPGLLLAIGLVAALGQGLWQIMLAVGVVNVPIFARLLRGSVLAQRETDFVLAARAVGVRRRAILFSHIL